VIPAKQRFKEIEEGGKREFIETIRDPLEIAELIPQIISSTYEELLLLFPTTNTFTKFELEGLFELVKHQIDKYNIYVKLLVKGYHYNYNYDKNKIESDSESDPVCDDGSIIRSEYLEKEEKQQNIELQLANESDTRTLTITADRDKLLTVEPSQYTHCKKPTTMNNNNKEANHSPNSRKVTVPISAVSLC